MKKILIIEDEKDLADVLGEKLARHGYQVIYAREGEEGLAKIKKDKPDLVLLDILMPKKNGLEVLQTMNKEGLMSVPVMVISNSGQPVEIEEVLKLGAKDYLVKTEFDPDEVIAKVAKLLNEEELETSQPVVEAAVVEPAGQSTAVPKPAGGAKRETILVVEDDKFLHELIEKKLTKQGYNVLGAESGSEAMRKIQDEKIDLILLDLILPDTNGYEILKQIKQNSDIRINQIPVLILSNLGQTDEIEKGMSLGAEDFLVKAHFTPSEIVEKIEKILAKSER